MHGKKAPDFRSGLTVRFLFIAATLVVAVSLASPLAAQCPEEPPLQNYTGSSFATCPCFVEGEQAGAVLEAPSEHYPIEILRVGIGWASFAGGQPQSLEYAIHIYDAGLPNPGAPIFTLLGPLLTDGAINEFNLEPQPGEITVDSGEFTVTLEFANDNAGNIYAPSMIHDNNGCQAGKNVVYAIPGGWTDACLLAVSGDWVVYAIYRQVDCGAGVDDEFIASTSPVLTVPRPNPFSKETTLEFVLAREERVSLSVYDVHGQVVARLADGVFQPGSHVASWSAMGSDGAPSAPGIYFVTMKAGKHRTTRRVVLSK